nr:MAG TPA: hypothetical protein [Caudoviricetes sp.]
MSMEKGTVPLVQTAEDGSFFAFCVTAMRQV